MKYYSQWDNIINLQHFLDPLPLYCLIKSDTFSYPLIAFETWCYQIDAFSSQRFCIILLIINIYYMYIINTRTSQGMGHSIRLGVWMLTWNEMNRSTSLQTLILPPSLTPYPSTFFVIFLLLFRIQPSPCIDMTMWFDNQYPKSCSNPWCSYWLLYREVNVSLLMNCLGSYRRTCMGWGKRWSMSSTPWLSSTTLGTLSSCPGTEEITEVKTIFYISPVYLVPCPVPLKSQSNPAGGWFTLNSLSSLFADFF